MRITQFNRNLVALVAVGGLLAACGGRDDGDSAGGGISDETIKIGATFPLSGPLSSNGQAHLGGFEAYLEALNAEGGVELSDGSKRQVELVYYDDAYDPSKMVQNFRKLVDQDQVMAVVGPFGTAPNLAVMPLATEMEVPQAFLMTGASVFSADKEANKWTIGWQPTYEAEGAAFAELLKSEGRPMTVAFIEQNDDSGKAYLSGLSKALEGSEVKIVAEETYEPSDPTLDSQISSLAASKADVLVSGVIIEQLQAAALSKVIELGWKPKVFLSVLTHGADTVVKPSGAAESLPELFAGFVKTVGADEYAEDPDVKLYLERMAEYSPDADEENKNAVWGYATGETLHRTLAAMSDLDRQGFMDSIATLEDQEIDLLLPGIVLDGTSPDQPLVSGFRMQQFVDGEWELMEN